MHFEGEIEVPVPKERLYAFIIDPAKVVSILPDVEESKFIDSDHFFVKSKLGMSYLRGTVGLNFEIAEKRKDEFARVVGHGQGIQSSIDLSLELTIEGAPSGSKGRWSADAKVGGLLASVGGRILNGVAEKYVKQITESLKQKVSAQ
jgi:uncharacterized protein